MIANIKDPKRNPHGAGPRRLCVYCGAGKRPTYEGLAGDFPLQPPLATVLRLRTLSLLAVVGPTRTIEVARRLDACYATVITGLWGMRDVHLVDCVRSPARIKGGGGSMAREWWITDDGRKWLWRFAWVTGRLDRRPWINREFEGRTDIEPWEVLRIGAHDSLCRPAGLATAAYLCHAGPISSPDVKRQTGVVVSQYYLRIWNDLGWTRTVPPDDPMRPYRRPFGAVPWIFTSIGYRAIFRHAGAVRYAGQRSAYAGAIEDNWYDDTLRCRYPGCTDEEIVWMRDGTWWPDEIAC